MIPLIFVFGVTVMTIPVDNIHGLTYPEMALRICIDRISAHQISGRVVGRRLSAPIVFSDLGTLVLQLDSMFDIQHTPPTYQRARSFADQDASAPACPASLERKMSTAEVDAACGEAATFLLYILSRHSSTWQGKVDWLDGTEDIFQSALELLNLVIRRMGQPR